MQAQPSRHDSNQSVPSMASSSSGSKSGHLGSKPAVESAVTKLLVAIKQLLESLTSWSNQKISEEDVSDVYVRLGNDFNATVSAFEAFNIDMSELMSVPEDLRNVLEQCLAENATPDNLEIYLPTVRQIITSLLQGLRGKQSIYRRFVSEHKHRSSSSTDQSRGQRTSSRTSRSDRASRRDVEGSKSHRSQLSRTIPEEDHPSGDSEGSMRRSAQRSGSGRKEPVSQTAVAPTLIAESEVPSPSPPPPNEGPDGSATSLPSMPIPRRQPISSPLPSMPSRSRSASGASDPTPRSSSRGHHSVPLESEEPPPTPPPQQAPASMKRYSLVDKPISPPAVIVNAEESPDHVDQRIRSPSPPETPPLDAMASTSLAALKKSDQLERRASKRFSTYNISKMTGGPTSRERSIRSNHPNRRSLAASNILTPGELNVLAEEDEEASSPTEVHTRGASRDSGSRTPLAGQGETIAVQPVPSSPPRTSSPVAVSTTAPSQTVEKEDGVHPEPSLNGSQKSFTVFLQLGREVKKVAIEPGLSFSSLRVLFVDKFSYNPGLENFPAIYIRDPSSGVQYELEDVSEVKPKCLLSLNIEPLDQIKQHIDSQISTLSNDLKDLKTAIANRPASNLPPIIAHDFSDGIPPPNRPTDRQLQHVARRLSRLVGSDGISQQSFMQHMQPQMTGQSLQTQTTGGSLLSEYSSRVMSDLRTQFDEVQNLRRDLGIIRQLYTDFMKQTKESLGTLRNQTNSVKQLATANVGGARGYIDSGKANLDSRSQNILTKVEALQDTVESVKEDVLKRHVTPKPQFVKSIKEDIDSAATELESLKEHIKTIKPMWKKTWEEELQNIVEEQQFLNHQEEFLADLLEDHKAVMEVYGHVEKVISIRGTGSGRIARKGGTFKPPPPDEGHNGLSTVMLEIRGAAVDPTKRMKAIEANQKNREKDLASRSDEFQAELRGFVGGKKLKMTGGAEEAERVRQKRSDMTLKAMFNGNGAAPSGVSEFSSASPGGLHQGNG